MPLKPSEIWLRLSINRELHKALKRAALDMNLSIS